jgi:GNAT superfamily N-acetyltransferase
MNLIQASDENDWSVASSLLQQVALDLDLRNKGLWSQKQVEESELRKNYKLDELFLLTDSSNILGMVFIQESDPLFWPEVEENKSIFLHKLAVLPGHKGRGFGRCIIELSIDIARLRGLEWVRLDCDVRPELIKYYEKNGFSLVNFAKIGTFEVARFELFLSFISA